MQYDQVSRALRSGRTKAYVRSKVSAKAQKPILAKKRRQQLSYSRNNLAESKDSRISHLTLKKTKSKHFMDVKNRMNRQLAYDREPGILIKFYASRMIILHRHYRSSSIRLFCLCLQHLQVLRTVVCSILAMIEHKHSKLFIKRLVLFAEERLEHARSYSFTKGYQSIKN